MKHLVSGFIDSNVFHKKKRKREAMGKNFRAQPSDGGQPGP